MSQDDPKEADKSVQKRGRKRKSNTENKNKGSVNNSAGPSYSQDEENDPKEGEKSIQKSGKKLKSKTETKNKESIKNSDGLPPPPPSGRKRKNTSKLITYNPKFENGLWVQVIYFDFTKILFNMVLVIEKNIYIFLQHLKFTIYLVLWLQ